MKKLLLSLVLLWTGSVMAQNVNIPDANFKAILLANTAINTDADKLNISVQEAAAYTGKLDVCSFNIVSLSGIEAFVNITDLYCTGSQITSLDVTKNTSLNVLY